MAAITSGQGIILPSRGKLRESQLRDFAERILDIGNQTGLRLSSRGWCYQLEGFGVITKAQFDRGEHLVNECRKKGLLPVDFVAEEEARAFSGIEKPQQETPQQYLKRYLEAALEAEEYYTPDWWDGEEYYIQMVVEKIDLKSLFEPICKPYHIPIATSRGWSPILQRAEYARRFKSAEARGLKCVLLYCGDHDPDGLRISQSLRNNLDDVRDVTWVDGEEGYDPASLMIDRFGLNFDFIEQNHLTSIDNLITGSGGDLASPGHPNHKQPYVQEYIRKFGPRKWEANSLVVRPQEARQLCQRAVEKYLGQNAVERFKSRRHKIRRILQRFRRRTGLDKVLKNAVKTIEKEGG